MKKEKLQLTLKKYKGSWANKMDNLEKMDRYLQRYNLHRLNQEETENMNRPITSAEIESVILKLPEKKKNSRNWGLHSWVVPYIRGINTSFSQTFPENFRGRSTPKLIYEATTTMISKAKIPKKKKSKLQANNTDEHRCKNPQQNISKLYKNIHLKDHTPWSSRIYPRDASFLQ